MSLIIILLYALCDGSYASLHVRIPENILVRNNVAILYHVRAGHSLGSRQYTLTQKVTNEDPSQVSQVRGQQRLSSCVRNCLPACVWRSGLASIHGHRTRTHTLITTAGARAVASSLITGTSADSHAGRRETRRRATRNRRSLQALAHFVGHSLQVTMLHNTLLV